MKLNPRHVIVGAALAAMAGGVSAADLTMTPAKYSKEGLELRGGDLTLGDIDVLFENNYSFNDVIRVDISGAELSSPNNVLVTCTTTAVGLLTPDTENQLKLRITDPAGATAGEVCTIEDLEVTDDSVASGAGKFKVCWTAYFGTSSEVIDEGCTSDTDLTAARQTGLKVNKELNAVIDVEFQRKQFTPGDDTTTSDTMTVAITSAATGFTTPTVDVTKQTVTVNGDFSWTDGSDTNTTCSLSELGTYVSMTGFTLATGSDCSKVVFTKTGAPIGDASSVMLITIPTGTSAKTLNPQDFTGSVKYDYVATGGSSTDSKQDSFDPGAWTQNGAAIYINYMPYDGRGGNISRIVYLSNRGSTNGQGQVELFSDAGDDCSFSIGAVAPGTVTKLTGLIDEAVYGCFGDDFSGKVHMVITVNAPANDIESYSAYNVGGSDRGTVVNTSNGRIVIGGKSN